MSSSYNGSFSSNFFANLKGFPITVLLIDDQLIISEALKQLIGEESDINYYYCSDSTKAFEMALAVKPTVILQDLVMPKKDGLTLIQEFRSHPETKDIPIIVLSTKEDPQIKAQAFALGSNDYVVKLPDKLELLARIRYHSRAFISFNQRNEAYAKLEESQRQLNSELAEAADYVRTLLPHPISNSIATDWRFLPSAQLGGDAFGYHWLDDNHFAIYLLDVCGHGVGAALLSISVVNLLKSENIPKANFKDPSSVLHELNLIFPMEKNNNMFFTIWYGVYDNQTHELKYSCAGHPPAILFTGKDAAHASIYELNTRDIVIGASPKSDFNNQTIEIENYNFLYIFSDGVYEISKKEGGMGQLEEFLEILKQFAGKTNDLDDIVAAIQNKQGKNTFPDDVSLLRLHFQR